MLCTSLVRKQLLKVDGVSFVKATLKDKIAKIECADNTSKEKLLEVVEKTGYKGIFVE